MTSNHWIVAETVDQNHKMLINLDHVSHVVGDERNLYQALVYMEDGEQFFMQGSMENWLAWINETFGKDDD